MIYVVNILGVCTAALCAVLLFKAYVKTARPLLLWSALCFAGLTLANIALVADRMIGPEIDLFRVRLGIAAASMLLLVYGLIVKSDL